MSYCDYLSQKQVTRQGKKQGYHNCCAKTANQLRQKECSNNANFVRQVARGKAIFGKERLEEMDVIKYIND